MFRKRILLGCLLVWLSTCPSVMAFGFLDDGVQNAIRTTWNAQTVAQLEQGIVAIPEEAINDYLVSVLPDYPTVTGAKLAIHGDNRIALDLNGGKSGKVKLEGTITRLVQNADESSMVISVDKRKLLDRPVASWVFAHVSLGMLTKIFGNPLSGSDQFTSQIHGNRLTINFKPYVDQSPLQSVRIMDVALLDLITIDSISTDEGIIYLHTSYHGPGQLLNLLKRVTG